MFDHERLDVYQVSLQFVAWVNERVDRMKGGARHSRDQILRSSESIPRKACGAMAQGRWYTLFFIPRDSL